MQMPIWASLPSQSLNGITKKIAPIAQQVSSDPHRCDNVLSYGHSQFYSRLSRYIVLGAIRNLFNCQVHLSSGAFHTSPATKQHRQQEQQDIPRRSLSVQIIEIVVNKRCSNWNIHFFFSLFPHSFSRRLMSQSGLVPSRCESERARERQFTQPSSQRGLCQSDLKVRSYNWVDLLSVSVACTAHWSSLMILKFFIIFILLRHVSLGHCLLLHPLCVFFLVSYIPCIKPATVVLSHSLQHISGWRKGKYVSSSCLVRYIKI